MGRPREFDLDEALAAALRVFWAKGFEGTTIADLTEATQLKRGSIYAAFGSKEGLFRRALDRYVATVFSYADDALAQPAVRTVVEKFLRGAVRASTGENTPAGCLLVQGALAAGDEAREIRDELANRRAIGTARLRERFERAAAEGDLPAHVDPEAVAHYVVALAQGIAVEASSGVSRARLDQLVDLALLRLPWEQDTFAAGGTL
ncbi:TetR/AcrR family transcriptional regulator [Saccharopolyspora sp. K220]|uniref:TetR/AcrR family transcriptional regulator n=1 Tax=Saccharopolyspora soli TaxID=2926618 RepID=UPI001F564C0C|nr:TetR/AcrR family transcriptional regulator [Saccharopolyspora soli]MCI2421170.1 TetR/AcrR family transcriptional regulator [Saccharopolyspora soli]